MIQKIKITLASLALVLGLGLVALPATSFASTSSDSACAGLTQISSSDDCNNDGKGLKNAISVVVQVLSYAVGIAAVIMIIISGFKYITSGGDSGRVGSAKNTLIYALVGLAIAGLAQFLVHFVLNGVSNPPAAPESSAHKDDPKKD